MAKWNKQAPRYQLSSGQRESSRSDYSTDELLEMALHMLDRAAEQQSGYKAFLHNNMTLEVIRDRVSQNQGKAK
jgi:hypothetical protein